MQSYSMVAIPMFVLMANFLTHSKVADGLFLSIRYLLGPLKGGLGLAVIVVSTVSLPRPVSSAHPLLPWACCPYRCC